MPSDKLHIIKNESFSGWAGNMVGNTKDQGALWKAPVTQPHGSKHFRYQALPKSGSMSIRSALQQYPGQPSGHGSNWDINALREDTRGPNPPISHADYCVNFPFGFTFVTEPLDHYIDGYVQIHHGASKCQHQTFQSEARSWATSRPRSHAENIHRCASKHP